MLYYDTSYPLMEQLSADDWELLNPEIVEQHYEANKLILKHGEVSQNVHIILSGQVRVFIEQESKVELALLERGHFFGEMSCLTGDPISAHVEAVDEVHSLVVSRTGMLLLMDKNTDFRKQMIEAMIKRIQNSNQRVLEEHTKTHLLMKQQESESQERYGELIGNSPAMKELFIEIDRLSMSEEHVIIVGEGGTGKNNIARKLHYSATNGLYPILTIHSEDFDLLNWDTKVRAAKGGTIIIERAEQLPHSVLQGLIDNEQQTRIIFTTAQRLGISNVATLYVPPLRERNEDIPLLAKSFLSKEGVAYVDDAISSDALRMLSLFPYLTNNVEELESVVKEAYILSEGRTIHSNHLRFGRARKPGERPKIGLALGSGSARGMAHLGVLNVLEEEGIPIDMIAGTSAGSLVGGAYAAGMSVADCTRVLSTIRWGHLVRLTFPKRSFVHNTPMIGFIEQHLGKRQIESLPIPFAAVASDTLTGEAHIMRSGSLAHAITASTAIPAIMRPVHHQEKHLSDGAVVHPVPAALVKSMGADIVIAVNVCAESFNKGAAKNFVDSLSNTIDMMSAKMVKEELQLADVILRPELGFNQISFKDAPFCIAAGEAVTRDAIERIRMKFH
ncbi:MAG: patatin-like phospholipase family protein [Candidatus Cohnella colombiensis]|uniref:Patatin-like phospholipase family protein n=1 Tax=Candidatus Cohnella colombiensis TaxID=3121368 RepID=A0AA95JD00_9BACL|nr:MAG: patatin-like phospholipase family protein [Cohnella sp.]